MKAIAEFSDINAIERLSMQKDIALLYRSIDEKLAHIGGNINQSMRRINEASIAGIPWAITFKEQMITSFL